MLSIDTDIPNVNDATDAEHYALAITMMALGVGIVKTDADRAKLIARATMLDTFPLKGGVKMTPAEFGEWVFKFGHIRTNVTNFTDAKFLSIAKKQALRDAERIVADMLAKSASEGE